MQSRRTGKKAASSVTARKMIKTQMNNLSGNPVNKRNLEAPVSYAISTNGLTSAKMNTAQTKRNDS